MKRSVILSMIAWCTLLGAQAQIVSTKTEKRNILLEDFTGFKCGNCPDGHTVVNRLALAQPERVFPIAVHAGYYATASAADQPNFLTAEGTEINDYFGIDSYPSGMVNRRETTLSGRVQSRSVWSANTRAQSKDDAEVNVWVYSYYEQDKNTVGVDVELYYTQDVQYNTSALCVSLLQSNILGPQAGGNMEDEYVHNHVLRAMLTPTWGETIEVSDTGTFIKKHYDYVVPEVIGNIETEPLDFDVVAYVINSDKEVMNVNGCKVLCPGLTRKTGATLEAYKLQPSRNYGFKYLECYLVNNGTERLTSATFRLTLDDEEEIDCAWEAWNDEGIACRERGYVQIPVDLPQSYVKSGCDYKLKLTSLNGQSVPGNTIKGSWGAMINVDGPVKAMIKTDNYADDNTFCLLDAAGWTVNEYGPYAEGKQATYEESIQFPESGIYCFEITDAWGNGMLSPRGNLKLYDQSGNLLVENKEISYFGYRVFFNYTPADAIKSVTKSTEKSIYNLAGQRLKTAAKGVNIVDGKKILVMINK